MGGRRPDMLHDVVVEGVQPHAVLLSRGEVGQAGGQKPCVVQLARLSGAVAHRGRHVEQEAHVGVRLRLELLDVEAVGACVEPPVDPADVVPRHVRPVLREIHAHAEVGRTVDPLQEPVHDGARKQLQVVDPCEDRGVQEGHPGHGRGAHADPDAANAGSGVTTGRVTRPFPTFRTAEAGPRPTASRPAPRSCVLRIRRGSW